MSNTHKTFHKYLTITEAASLWGVVCTTIGFQNIDRHSKYPLMQHPMGYTFRKESGRILHEYQLLYITDGKGIFESASIRKTEIGAGTVILLFPGEWHTYYPDFEIGWTEHWVGFCGSNIDNIIKGGFFSKENPIVRLGFHSTLIDHYLDIIKSVEKEKAGFQQYISGSIMQMLGYIYYKQRNIEYGDSPIVEKIDQARKIMREHISDNISPEEIASSLGLGYTWFRRTFKEYVGSSPGQYQLQLKHMRAKELLIDMSKSVSEVCFAIGFENTSQFSTFFRKHEGLSPAQYRKKFFD